MYARRRLYDGGISLDFSFVKVHLVTIQSN